jgi:signal peptidase II
MARRYKLFLIVSLAILFFDQATKYWARAALAKYGFKGYPIIEGYWDMRLSYNTGSAFGLFSKIGGARVILSLVGIGACVAIVMILRKAKDAQRWLTVALGLVAGGAVGNVIDRILFGKVTDFVVWKYGRHEWPAFNIADAALVVGVAILFFDAGREGKEKKARSEGEERRA